MKLLDRLTARAAGGPLSLRVRPRRLLAAVCIALACALLAWLLTPDQGDTPIVVAADDLAPGAEITRGDLTVVDYPRQFVPEKTFSAVDEALGRRTSAGISKGTPVTRAAVLDEVSGLRIEEVDAFTDFIVVSYRRGGFARVGIVRLHPAGSDDATAEAGGQASGFGDASSPFGPLEELPFDRETGTLGLASNPEFDQPSIRLTFTSMSTPAVVYQHDVATGTDTVLKRQPVLGSVDLGAYGETLVWATAEGGTRVPVSLVYRTDLVDVDADGRPTASASTVAR